jgi:hypothetical protein
MAISRGSSLAFCCAFASSLCLLVAFGCGALVTFLWALPEVRDCFLLFFVECDGVFYARLLVVVRLDSLRVI